MKFFSKTFGCQMNFADSDEMSGHLDARGFTPTDNPEEADAFLVNTCTVRDMAEHKASSYIGRLKEWKEADPNRILIVTGCAAERAKQEFKRRFPYIDLIVGAKDIEKFPAALNGILDIRNQERLLPESLGSSSLQGVSQAVTIMRGCNYNCTYCIVPAVRGREKYLPVEAILAEARRRAESGAKEIWLLGQTVNSYRPENPPEPGYDFSNLLRDIDKIDGIERIRFTSPHPYYVTPRLIDAMASARKVCEHIHLPVQSGSDEVLKRMKRNYTRGSYLTALDQLRKAIPGVAVTTDVIVGFPGETEADFEATVSLVKEAGFDSAYCFKYSPRPGTAAAAMEDDVPMEIKEDRVNRILAVTDSQGTEKAKSLIGTEQEILIEDDKGEGVFRGKTRTAWRARLADPALRIGDLVRARIVRTHSRELHAERVLVNRS